MRGIARTCSVMASVARARLRSRPIQASMPRWVIHPSGVPLRAPTTRTACTRWVAIALAASATDAASRDDDAARGHKLGDLARVGAGRQEVEYAHSLAADVAAHIGVPVNRLRSSPQEALGATPMAAGARGVRCGMADFRVVICGGGIAAVEGLLRLRRLAGDSLEIELVAPDEELVYRPLAVRQPFAFGRPGATRCGGSRAIRRRNGPRTRSRGSTPTPRSCTRPQAGAWNTTRSSSRSAPGRWSHTSTSRRSETPTLTRPITGSCRTSRGLHAQARVHSTRRPVWPLPLYELALMTAERAESMDIRDLELSLVTPEPRPLAVFGTAVGEVVASRLASAGVTVYTNSLAKVPAARRLVIQPQNVELEDQRIVAMPRVAGPAIRGLPGGGSHGFLPIDKHCAVRGTEGRVFAAGDAANYPIKHGGLGAQMADAAAAAIAVLAGAPEKAPPFNPVIRGKLLTGRDPVYMSAHPVGAESFESEVYDEPPWPADEKVVAEELGPYLSQDSDHARCALAAPGLGLWRAPWTVANWTSGAFGCCSRSAPR